MKKIFLILALSITAQHAINPSVMPIEEIKNFTKKNQDLLIYGLMANKLIFTKIKDFIKKGASSLFEPKKPWCRRPTKEELENAKKSD